MMSEQGWILVAVGCAIALGWMASAFFSQRRRQREWKELNDLMVAAGKVSEDIEKQAEMEKSVLRQRLAEAEAARAQSERIAQGHIKMHAEFEASRDEAWQLYKVQSMQAGNAQAMLFRELERVVVELNAYRKHEQRPEFQINPQIARVMSDFKVQHVEQRSQS